MPKAILELEMPESCRACKLNKWDVWEHHRYVSINVLVCAALGEECSDKGRRSDCPLKLAEGKENGCEYCNTEHNKFLTDDVFMATTNSYGDKNRVITSRHGLQYKTIRYCPMCGRRLEVEP
jgi:hypothetical protein